MQGMMASMWIWALAGILVIVVLVFAIVKLMKK